MKSIFKLLLLLLTLPAFSQSTITVPTSGNIATEEWVKQFLFNELEKVTVPTCDLKATSVVHDGTALEFSLTGTLPGLNLYSVRITKGDFVRYWNDVPYQAGERMRLENVPSIDSARVTIRPTISHTCFYSFGINLGGGSNPDPGDTTTVPKPNCDAGPSISSVYNISQTGLSTQFHGINVTLIKWTISTTTGTEVRTSLIAPTSSVLNLSFSTLTSGNYILKLSGENCTGFSTFPFFVPEPSPGPDPDPGPEPGTGDITAKVSISGLDQDYTHINFTCTGSSKNWVFTDLSTVTPPSGYNFMYVIGSDIIRTSTRLQNYQYKSDNPITIAKLQIKIGVTDIYGWHGNGADGDETIGVAFSQNCSIAFWGFVFNRL